MNLVILDLVSSNFDELDSSCLIASDAKILALTPSAFYYLELNNIEYISYHDLITTEQFRNDILSFYKETSTLNSDSIYFKGFFCDIAQYINYFYYIDIIINYIEINDFNKLHYITDKQANNDNILNNNNSLLHKYINFTEVTIINKKDNIRQEKNNFLKKYTFSTFFKKLKSRLLKSNLQYDWLNINPNKKKKLINVSQSRITFCINNFKYLKPEKLKFDIPKGTSKMTSYMTFLTHNGYIQTLEYKKINQKAYFFQHGSYLYKNIFIKPSEVDLADINFVFNDYTKKLFETLDTKNVFSVGSIFFNKPIKEKKKQYDFLYITQAHDYMGSLQYVDFSNSLHSFDGYELYQRHKNIIKLFGEQFKNKKIIIRVHPGVLSVGVYVPFWELAKKYSNITIDVSFPIHTLIEKSKYIISDYFTTEFINKELHYKRDIILFKGAPTPLPEETMEDMEKMFILVETCNDLKNKIEKIKNIIKNRRKYDDIIEYYSSKKCDTKKIVTSILEKELNERR